MKEFTGWEYLLIDVANHWGMDKARFEERIEWALNYLPGNPERVELEKQIKKMTRRELDIPARIGGASVVVTAIAATTAVPGSILNRYPSANLPRTFEPTAPPARCPETIRFSL